jgi:cell division protein FtsQ
VVVAFPRGRPGVRLDLARVAPSGRSLLAAIAIAVAAAGGYLTVRNTSVFAVNTIDVQGGRPAIALQVRDALAPHRGTSLLRLDLERVRAEAEALPTVAAVTLDRAFPHTLRVRIVPERPVAVIRQGATSWLVSARGRIMSALVLHARRGLPRIWIPKGPVLMAGGMAPPTVHESLAAVSPLRSTRFATRVTSVRVASDELTLILRSGLELRLGDTTDVRLKLAVAARVLPHVAGGTRYLDVSVPERPVAGSIVRVPKPATVPHPVVTTGAVAATPARTADAINATPGSRTLNSKVEVDGAGSIGP